jgi:lysozyme family protein
MSLFELAIPTVLRREGGYVNDPNDAGGETNFGISKRSYPDVDIKGLTAAAASAIYKRDWWDRYNYGAIGPQAVATKVLDCSVNLGAERAHKMVQQAVGVEQDGVLGPVTLSELNTRSSLKVIVSLQDIQAAYYRALVAENPERQKYLSGWLARAYDRN